MMQRRLLAAALVLAAALAFVTLPARAEDGGLSVSMGKDWGFSLGRQVQGTFTLTARGPADLSTVTFLIDGQPMGAAQAAPFRLQFQTAAYAYGRHTLGAVGQTSGGRTLQSNELAVEFVTSGQGWAATRTIILPLVGVVLLATLLGVGSSLLLANRKRPAAEPGAPRHYGAAGGTICASCGRPFARGFFSPNLIGGKLERCPYCGHWGVVRAASKQALAAAEAAEIAAAQPGVPAESAEEKLRRQIEESRYQ